MVQTSRILPTTPSAFQREGKRRNHVVGRLHQGEPLQFRVHANNKEGTISKEDTIRKSVSSQFSIFPLYFV